MKLWRSGELRSNSEFFEVLETTERTQFATMTLEPGQASGEFGNKHAGSDQWLIVIDGQGEAVGQSGAEPIGPGDVVLIAAPEKHQFRCTGNTPLRTITLYGPVAYPDEQ